MRTGETPATTTACLEAVAYAGGEDGKPASVVVDVVAHFGDLGVEVGLDGGIGDGAAEVSGSVAGGAGEVVVDAAAALIGGANLEGEAPVLARAGDEVAPSDGEHGLGGVEAHVAGAADRISGGADEVVVVEGEVVSGGDAATGRGVIGREEDAGRDVELVVEGKEVGVRLDRAEIEIAVKVHTLLLGGHAVLEEVESGAEVQLGGDFRADFDSRAESGELEADSGIMGPAFRLSESAASQREESQGEAGHVISLTQGLR